MVTSVQNTFFFKVMGGNISAIFAYSAHASLNLLWVFTFQFSENNYYPGQKKRTIAEIRGEKNAVPRVISCSIRRDQHRAKVADSRGSALRCADRAWSSMISHVEQRSSHRESRWWFFFFFVQGSMMHSCSSIFFFAVFSPLQKLRPPQAR